MKRFVCFFSFIILSLIYNSALGQSSMAFFYCTGSAQELQSSVEVRVNGKKIAKIIPGEVCKSILKSGRNSIECARIGFGEKRIDIDITCEGLSFFHIQLNNGSWDISDKDESEVPPNLAQFAKSTLIKEQTKLEEDNKTKSLSHATITGLLPPRNSKLIMLVDAPTELDAEALLLKALFESSPLKDCIFIDRKNLDLILEEQKLSLTALFGKSEIEIGELISAEFICQMKILPTSNSTDLLLSVHLINLSSGEITYSYTIIGSLEFIKNEIISIDQSVSRGDQGR